jgi:cell division septal protein FtsQ
VFRIVASWMAAVATLAGVVLGGRYGWEALATSGTFAVRNIEVTGTVRALEPDIVAYAGVKLGDAMLALDLDDIAMSLRRHPWVDSATVKRRLPDKVTIEITEHDPIVVVALGSEAGTGVVDLYVANRRGELVKRQSSDDKLDVPVLTGLSRESAARDAEAVHARVREATEVAHLVQSRVNALGRVDELHWDDALGWSVVTRVTGAHAMTTHLGREPRQALDVAATALARLTQLGAAPRVLWADAPLGRSFIQARIEAPARGDMGPANDLLATAR